MTLRVATDAMVEPLQPASAPSAHPGAGGAWRRRAMGALTALAAVALVAYPLAVYAGLTHFSPRVAALGLLVLIAPIVLSRLRRLDAQALRTVALIPLLTAVLLGLGAALDAAGFVLAVPVVINAVLLATFGASLKTAQPMIERFARLQVPDLPPDEVAWCRQWTVAWCAFFSVNGLTAAALALWAPLAWWAAYNGLVAYALMGTLFTVEFAWRKRRFPHRLSDAWYDRALARLLGIPRDPEAP